LPTNTNYHFGQSRFEKNILTFDNIYRCFCQLLITSLIEKTFVDNSHIELADGLFISCTKNALDNFYHGINSYLTEKIFFPDDFDVQSIIDNNINNINFFASHITDIDPIIYTFRENKYIINQDIITKYNFEHVSRIIDQLVVNDRIMTMSKNCILGLRIIFQHICFVVLLDMPQLTSIQIST